MKKVNESEFVETIKSAKLDFIFDCFVYDDEENINYCLAYNQLVRMVSILLSKLDISTHHIIQQS